LELFISSPYEIYLKGSSPDIKKFSPPNLLSWIIEKKLNTEGSLYLNMTDSPLEGLGEKTLALLESLYVLILDLLIKITPFFKGVNKRIQTFDRERFYPFFEKRNIEPSDYTIFKLQLSSAIFLILTTLLIINYISGRTFAYLGGLLILLSIYLLFSTVKRQFRDFAAYRDFFLLYYLLMIILALIKIKKPIVTTGFPFFHFTAVAILGALAIYLYFNKKYSREFTFGRVISDRGIDLKVKLNYDIRSNTKPQISVIRNTMNAREGDIVKVRVNRGFLSLKGSTPVEIIGVDWS
jgi:uncharacterized membrane protein